MRLLKSVLCQKGFRLPLWVELLVWAVLMVGWWWTGTAHAQVIDPRLGQAAYMTADPIDPSRWGLATVDGRYAVTPVQGCDDLGVGSNVWIYPDLNIPPWLAAAPQTWDEPGQPPCLLRVEGRMSDIPCFVNEVQLCDVAAESDEGGTQ